MQHGRAILYINGASGTISGNKVYDFQKNGIEISGLTADGSALSAAKTSATVENNVVTGEGHIDYIAQNGIVIRSDASAVVKNNTVSHLFYTPAGTEATGLLNYDAGKITVSGNTFVDTETRIDGVVIANVTGHSTKTIRPHGVRIDLFSNAKPAAETVLGKKLDWKVKVDGRVTFHDQAGLRRPRRGPPALRDRLRPARGPGPQEQRRRAELRRPLLNTTLQVREEPRPIGPGLFPIREQIDLGTVRARGSTFSRSVPGSRSRSNQAAPSASGAPRR